MVISTLQGFSNVNHEFVSSDSKWQNYSTIVKIRAMPVLLCFCQYGQNSKTVKPTCSE